MYESSSDGSQLMQGDGNTMLYRAPATATHLSDYTATIDWGDGTISAGTLVSDSAYQTNALLNAHVTGDHTYTTTGNYQATVTISGPGIYDNNGQHSDGNQLTGHFDVAVVPQTLSASATQVGAAKNVSFTGTVATFSDSSGNGSPGSYQATITWGDGSTSGGMIFSDGHGGYAVQGTHTYTYEGTLPLSVRIQKTGAAACLVTGTATVEAVSSLVATQSVPLGITTVESFQYKSDWNWTTDATVYTRVQQQWYYGTDPNIITYQAADGSTITQYPIYGAGSSSGSGSYPTSYAYSLHGGSSSEQYFSYNYDNSGYLSSSDGSQLRQGDGDTMLYRAPASATHLSDYTATIDWGDGTTSTGALVSDSTYQTNAILNAHVTGDHTYTTTGNYQATVTINGPGIYDNNGQHSDGNQLTGHLDVAVVPQTLSASVVQVEVAKKVSFTGTVATFSDSSGNGVPGNYQAAITWGDGAVTGGMISSDGHGGYAVQGTHTYTYEGTLPLSVRIQKTGAAACLVTGTATVEAVSALVATQSVPLGTTMVESFQYKSDWNWSSSSGPTAWIRTFSPIRPPMARPSRSIPSTAPAVPAPAARHRGVAPVVDREAARRVLSRLPAVGVGRLRGAAPVGREAPRHLEVPVGHPAAPGAVHT
jgi:hypothetical protein